MIHSNSWSDHLSHLKSVFIKIKEAGLTAKPSKCNIGHAEVQFMGHFVGKGFVHPLQSKIETIRNYPIPKTKKQVRQAIGLFSYYRKFIPNFAEIAYPITDLTKKGRTNVVAWTTECDLAFKQLKEAMCNEPILRLPDQASRKLLPKERDIMLLLRKYFLLPILLIQGSCQNVQMLHLW